MLKHFIGGLAKPLKKSRSLEAVAVTVVVLVVVLVVVVVVDVLVV